MKRSFNIAVLSGDGIGPEVVPVAVKVLEAVGRLHGLAFTFKESSIGGSAIDQYGQPLPQETLALCKASDSVLLGAVGGAALGRAGFSASAGTCTTGSKGRAWFIRQSASGNSFFRTR